MTLMTEVVIDTNVIVVADNGHSECGVDCLSACIDRLEKVKKFETVVVDEDHQIIKEYLGRVRTSGKAKTLGGEFLKWLMQNLSNADHCLKIKLHQTGHGLFSETPTGFHGFDKDDLKFLAVANTVSPKPPILQAVDTKWGTWSKEFDAAGILIENLCPSYVALVAARRRKGA